MDLLLTKALRSLIADEIRSYEKEHANKDEKIDGYIKENSKQSQQ